MALKFILPVSVLALSISSAFAQDTQTTTLTETEVAQANFRAEKEAQIKHALKAKLETFNGFSANFQQDVIDAEGNALQSSNGKLVVKRPNLIYWETIEPDETLVVSDGTTLWFYNPFVEQVSAFNVSNAVVNTPILLLSDTSADTWQDYQVSQQSMNEYSIKSLDIEAQVKSLNLVFDGNQLAMFTIVDATGQLSHFKLSNMITEPSPSSDIFKFSLPANVDFDDQR
ncbi:outer membrane lipoprotein chaperone LolA [Thalassomonas sp. M1454]|uniref:outer membrane lipoprotein chaperone LolA n=1 Tax=Thalassomonas sp. M1454 TaxID=2594477 RepID=UPI00117C41A1|nr:outer membrane lipoprotein chaperone LolA [Thalassomonas sp. M1454]TRX56898.1 outer membrane lipoprotein chaperone LolA [Thalassomonas sp. M1454]